jgi:hypothetical protein
MGTVIGVERSPTSWATSTSASPAPGDQRFRSSVDIVSKPVHTEGKHDDAERDRDNPRDSQQRRHTDPEYDNHHAAKEQTKPQRERPGRAMDTPFRRRRRHISTHLVAHGVKPPTIAVEILRRQRVS